MSYTAIYSQTVGTATATVEFTSIPDTYRDLVLVCSPIQSTGSQTVNIRFNSDANTNYREVIMFGDGTTTTSQLAAARSSVLGQATANASTDRINLAFQIFDYAQTDKHKSVIVRSSSVSSGSLVNASVNRWANTAAITSITCTGFGNYAVGSTFALYGILA